MSETLSTEALPAKQRLPFWIDMICQTYVQLECDAPNRDAFSGSIVTHRLPGLDLSVVSSRAQRVMRTPPDDQQRG